MISFKSFLEVDNNVLAQLKQLLPNWPDYIIDDMIMAGFRNPNGFKTIEDAKNYLDTTFVQQYGRQANQVRWQQMPVNINMNVFDSVTMQTLPQRVQGEEHQGPTNKNDASRGAFAADSLQDKTSYDEPVILAKMGSKYQLIEGWHRVIQLLRSFPQGTTQKAWVML